MQFLLFIIAIIMQLCLLSILKIYISFEDLLIIINIHTSKESYAITTKHSKQKMEGKLQMV